MKDVWHPSEPIPVAPDHELADWYKTAKVLHQLRAHGNPVDLRTHFADLDQEPVTCVCGKPYYNDDDYMCPACREVLDAEV